MGRVNRLINQDFFFFILVLYGCLPIVQTFHCSGIISLLVWGSFCCFGGFSLLLSLLVMSSCKFNSRYDAAPPSLRRSSLKLEGIGERSFPNPRSEKTEASLPGRIGVGLCH